MSEITANTAASTLRGSNQARVRAHHERVLLSLIRLRRTMHKVDMARLSGLSMQTVSTIVNQLTEDGLLLKGMPQRGRVGQPSVPYSLNPEGALALGINVGRRSADLHLIDFTGRVVKALHKTYPYPTVPHVLDFAAAGIDEIVSGLNPERAARIAGLGIGAPYDLWMWREEMGANQDELEPWRTVDIRGELAKLCSWPVYYSNDITAACAAELMFGVGGDYVDYLYVFVGSFVGGGLVLNGHLFPGRTQNAAALGSMPAFGGQARNAQLVNVASIYVLERQLVAEGRDASILWRSPDDWGHDLGPALDTWIEDVAEHLAVAIVAAISVIDVETVIIDGAVPEEVRRRLIARTSEKVESANRQGLSPFRIVSGTIGSGAPAIGGASLPLLANFSQDREILFKET